MKIVHLCLANPYIDGWGYQENTLPKVQKDHGYDVSIIASVENKQKDKFVYVNPSKYTTEHGIPITRIPYVKWLPLPIVKKLRIYNNLMDALETACPDIIFIHSGGFLSITTIVKYKLAHPRVKIFVDSHADYVNANKNWIARRILHGLIYKWCWKQIYPFAEKIWGTLPLRCKYLHEVFGVSYDKIDFLPMGFDTSGIDFTKKDLFREQIRTKYNISDSDFLIVTGGKIERRKNVDVLIESIASLNNPAIKLLIFGSPTAEMKPIIDDLQAKYPNIVHQAGWVKSDEIYKYLFSSDLAVFPGTHSVIWEQSVALGVPCIFKRWDGIEHVDLGGNCLLVDDLNVKNLSEAIQILVSNPEILSKMRKISEVKGAAFKYDFIAEQAIGFEENKYIPQKPQITENTNSQVVVGGVFSPNRKRLFPNL